ncbi:Outer membrane protein OmpA [Cognatiyoonia koreensis]|uniref:Outer membrane protein OmpA n=1 Tax=Cognatiyoonia koreensis TaxID=364200 RepID=A0A1I0MNU4_9RHOB|nr:OmpA family protein [Cognatiyoonia koreensis]SEV89672.1 Outer membrane protein OmpA [Cognatiyoonia koreensis]
MKFIITATIATGLLAGCANSVIDPNGTFYKEAGAQVDRGDFGNATMNNMLVQSGQSSYTINLQRRFTSEVDDTITFEFNSSQLTAAGQATLAQQAAWIKQFPEVRFKVFGHADAVGSNAYNQRLGLRRAQTAVGYLVSQGISRSRLEAIASFGETRPVVNTQAPEMRNRRAVTEVSGFVENHPTVLNGKYAEVIFREYVASAVPPAAVTPVGSAAGGNSGGSGGQ